ncbi:MAG: hypothetical protein EP338_06165 [Bacteroidetes bacterium]|nr:MAG: hypothetical protein EP338_06165 [Bacteroidota bacterium]
MNYFIELAVSFTLVFFLLFDFVRIQVFKKERRAGIAAVLVILSIGFGLYLWLKYAGMMDSGELNLIQNSRAPVLEIVGIIDIAVGVLAGIFSLSKLMSK